MRQGTARSTKGSRVTDGWWRHTGREFWRVRWPLGISIAVVVLRSRGIIPKGTDESLVLYKCALATIGFVLAHMTRQQAFPYINLGELLRSRSPMFGPAVVGMAIIYAAFVLGITLGL